MDPFILVTIKLLVGFFALVIIINVSGKGNLAPSSASDQITNYVLGGIIGGVIYNNSISIYDFIIILSMKWIKQHSVKAKQLIDGKAMIIIDNGKIDIENCERAGLSAHDVAFKLRTNGVYSSKSVKRAIIEQNGQLIIVQAGEENPKFPIITDGQLQEDVLNFIGKDEDWLKSELKKQGVDEYSEVFLGEYIDKTLHITTYEKPETVARKGM